MRTTEKMEKTSRVSQEWEVVQEIHIQKLQRGKIPAQLRKTPKQLFPKKPQKMSTTLTSPKPPLILKL